MINPKLQHQSLITIEPFAQVDEYACVGACLANLGRLLLQEDSTPQSIDAELHRMPDEEVTNFQKYAWILDRGLTILDITAPSECDWDGYCDGRIDFETFLGQIARQYFDGNLENAREDCDNDEYRLYLERTKAERSSAKEYKGKYTALGKYREEERLGDVEDIATALTVGGVVLYVLRADSDISHQELLYSDSSEPQAAPTVYSPGIDTGMIFTIDLSSPDISEYIDFRNLIIVTK